LKNISVVPSNHFSVSDVKASLEANAGDSADERGPLVEEEYAEDLPVVKEDRLPAEERRYNAMSLHDSRRLILRFLDTPKTAIEALIHAGVIVLPRCSREEGCSRPLMVLGVQNSSEDGWCARCQVCKSHKGLKSLSRFLNGFRISIGIKKYKALIILHFFFS
jgi:hypothetical protein